MSEHDETLTPKTRTTLAVVVSSVSLAVLMTVEWINMKFAINEHYKEGLTTQQAQQWIDNAREQNRVTAPNVTWPRLPDKAPEQSRAMQADAVD